MNKIYEKNRVTFAIICIVIYVVGTSLAEAMAESLGIVKLPSMIFHLIYTAAIFLWLKRNRLFDKYGLKKPEYPLSKACFFIPLLLIGFSSIYFGVTLKYSVPETAFYMISMICVGFLEEIIFRGFLFLGMAEKNIKSAILVSSVTFGIGHIVNLLNGKPVLETLLQIVFATAVGFVLVMLFHKGKCLIPCIIFHSINNSLSAISNDEASLRFFGSVEKEMYISVGFSLVICLLYLAALLHNFKSEE